MARTNNPERNKLPRRWRAPARVALLEGVTWNSNVGS
jgi:hypothetical protein